MNPERATSEEKPIEVELIEHMGSLGYTRARQICEALKPLTAGRMSGEKFTLRNVLEGMPKDLTLDDFLRDLEFGKGFYDDREKAYRERALTMQASKVIELLEKNFPSEQK